MSSERITDESFVTLATNTNYVLGALALAQSLKTVKTNRLLTILITKEVPPALQEHLREVFDKVELVDLLDSKDLANLELLRRPDLGVTFTKLHCWNLVQFKKCVFIDADCLVLKNVDELFEREEFSAVTDIGWPDCFNSGVFVYRPSHDTYTRLVDFATSTGSFDGGDQGLLNSFFNDWSSSESSKRLSFIYNMTTNANYSYAPAFKNFKDNVKIVHFIGSQKPWYFSFDVNSNQVVSSSPATESEYLNTWWNLFLEGVFPKLSVELQNRINTQLVHKAVNRNTARFGQQQQQEQQSHSGGNFSNESQFTSTNVTSGGVVVGSNQHQNLWESGQVDFSGRDSFSNIQAHLDSQLKK